MPLSVQSLTNAEHAVAVSTGSTQTACGEISSVPDSSGALAIVRMAEAGGVGGIAYLGSVAGDPAASIGLSLFVGGAVLDGIDDASVASATAELPPTAVPFATVPAPTTAPEVPTATPESAAGAPARSDDRGTRENPLPIGTAADIGGGWIVSVVDVNLDAADVVMAENMFNEPPEPAQQYVLITISATYEGSDASAVLLAGSAFHLVGESEIAYQSFDPGCGVTPDDFPMTEVFFGGTLTGTICFAVDAEDVPSLVMYSEEVLSFDSDRRV